MKMKTKKEVQAELARIKKQYDEYGRKPVLVEINATMALIQVQLDATERAFRWVLGGTQK